MSSEWTYEGLLNENARLMACIQDLEREVTEAQGCANSRTFTIHQTGAKLRLLLKDLETLPPAQPLVDPKPAPPLHETFKEVEAAVKATLGHLYPGADIHVESTPGFPPDFAGLREAMLEPSSNWKRMAAPPGPDLIRATDEQLLARLRGVRTDREEYDALLEILRRYRVAKALLEQYAVRTETDRVAETLLYPASAEGDDWASYQVYREEILRDG